MKILINFLVTALLVFLAANYLPLGISLENGYTSALIFSVVLALINMTLGSVLRLLGFPINFITLGLFSFIVTLIVIWVTDYLYSGVAIDGILAYLFIAFLPAITGAVVGTLKKLK